MNGVVKPLALLVCAHNTFFKHAYREGTVYFCCESCMRKYEEARKELMNNKRKNRYAIKK